MSREHSPNESKGPSTSDTNTGEAECHGDSDVDVDSGMHGVSTLTGAPESSTNRVILHVDCDCFYAACERLRDESLVGEPVIVGMGYEQEDPSGAVATASYEAREHGVESAMTIGDALNRLPRMADVDSEDSDTPAPDAAGYYRPVDMEYYESIGNDVHTILERNADTFEPVSIDEAYLDVTTRTDWETVSEFAEELKQTIREEARVPVSIGVAPTKSAAKVASDLDKPNGLVIVEPGTVREFFEPLEIELVHGIGPVTASKLRDMGIETAGDLAVTDPGGLINKFGERGKEAHQRARGHDPRAVTPPDDPKSISNESSLGDPVTDIEVKRQALLELSNEVTERAVEQNALYRTVGIKVVEPPFDVNTRARTLSGPVHNPDLVESIVSDLLEEFAEVPVRKVGVRVSNLTFSENQQPMLTEWETESETNPGEVARGSRSIGGRTARRKSSRQTEMSEYGSSEPGE